jgi:hypothetical protein
VLLVERSRAETPTLAIFARFADTGGHTAASGQTRA